MGATIPAQRHLLLPLVAILILLIIVSVNAFQTRSIFVPHRSAPHSSTLPSLSPPLRAVSTEYAESDDLLMDDEDNDFDFDHLFDLVEESDIKASITQVTPNITLITDYQDVQNDCIHDLCFFNNTIMSNYLLQYNHSITFRLSNIYHSDVININLQVTPTLFSPQVSTATLTLAVKDLLEHRKQSGAAPMTVPLSFTPNYDHHSDIQQLSTQLPAQLPLLTLLLLTDTEFSKFSTHSDIFNIESHHIPYGAMFPPRNPDATVYKNFTNTLYNHFFLSGYDTLNIVLLNNNPTTPQTPIYDESGAEIPIFDFSVYNSTFYSPAIHVYNNSNGFIIYDKFLNDSANLIQLDSNNAPFVPLQLTPDPAYNNKVCKYAIFISYQGYGCLYEVGIVFTIATVIVLLYITTPCARFLCDFYVLRFVKCCWYDQKYNLRYQANAYRIFRMRRQEYWAWSLEYFKANERKAFYTMHNNIDSIENDGEMVEIFHNAHKNNIALQVAGTPALGPNNNTNDMFYDGTIGAALSTTNSIASANDIRGGYFNNCTAMPTTKTRTPPTFKPKPKPTTTISTSTNALINIDEGHNLNCNPLILSNSTTKTDATTPTSLINYQVVTVSTSLDDSIWSTKKSFEKTHNLLFIDPKAVIKHPLLIQFEEEHNIAPLPRPLDTEKKELLNDFIPKHIKYALNPYILNPNLLFNKVHQTVRYISALSTIMLPISFIDPLFYNVNAVSQANTKSPMVTQDEEDDIDRCQKEQLYSPLLSTDIAQYNPLFLSQQQFILHYFYQDCPKIVNEEFFYQFLTQPPPHVQCTNFDGQHSYISDASSDEDDSDENSEDSDNDDSRDVIADDENDEKDVDLKRIAKNNNFSTNQPDGDEYDDNCVTGDNINDLISIHSMSTRNRRNNENNKADKNGSAEGELVHDVTFINESSQNYNPNAVYPFPTTTSYRSENDNHNKSSKSKRKSSKKAQNSTNPAQAPITTQSHRIPTSAHHTPTIGPARAPRLPPLTSFATPTKVQKRLLQSTSISSDAYNYSDDIGGDVEGNNVTNLAVNDPNQHKPVRYEFYTKPTARHNTPVNLLNTVKIPETVEQKAQKENAEKSDDPLYLKHIAGTTKALFANIIPTAIFNDPEQPDEDPHADPEQKARNKAIRDFEKKLVHKNGKSSTIAGTDPDTITGTTLNVVNTLTNRILHTNVVGNMNFTNNTGNATIAGNMNNAVYDSEFNNNNKYYENLDFDQKPQDFIKNEFLELAEKFKHVNQATINFFVKNILRQQPTTSTSLPENDIEMQSVQRPIPQGPQGPQLNPHTLFHNNRGNVNLDGGQNGPVKNQSFLPMFFPSSLSLQNVIKSNNLSHIPNNHGEGNILHTLNVHQQRQVVEFMKNNNNAANLQALVGAPPDNNSINRHMSKFSAIPSSNQNQISNNMSFLNYSMINRNTPGLNPIQENDGKTRLFSSENTNNNIQTQQVLQQGHQQNLLFSNINNKYAQFKAKQQQQQQEQQEQHQQEQQVNLVPALAPTVVNPNDQHNHFISNIPTPSVGNNNFINGMIDGQSVAQSLHNSTAPVNTVHNSAGFGSYNVDEQGEIQELFGDALQLGNDNIKERINTNITAYLGRTFPSIYERECEIHHCEWCGSDICLSNHAKEKAALAAEQMEEKSDIEKADTLHHDKPRQYLYTGDLHYIRKQLELKQKQYEQQQALTTKQLNVNIPVKKHFTYTYSTLPTISTIKELYTIPQPKLSAYENQYIETPFFLFCCVYKPYQRTRPPRINMTHGFDWEHYDFLHHIQDYYYKSIEDEKNDIAYGGTTIAQVTGAATASKYYHSDDINNLGVNDLAPTSTTSKYHQNTSQQNIQQQQSPFIHPTLCDLDEKYFTEAIPSPLKEEDKYLYSVHQHYRHRRGMCFYKSRHFDYNPDLLQSSSLLVKLLFYVFNITLYTAFINSTHGTEEFDYVNNFKHFKHNDSTFVQFQNASDDDQGGVSSHKKEHLNNTLARYEGDLEEYYGTPLCYTNFGISFCAILSSSSIEVHENIFVTWRKKFLDNLAINSHAPTITTTINAIKQDLLSKSDQNTPKDPLAGKKFHVTIDNHLDIYIHDDKTSHNAMKESEKQYKITRAINVRKLNNDQYVLVPPPHILDIYNMNCIESDINHFSYGFVMNGTSNYYTMRDDPTLPTYIRLHDMKQYQILYNMQQENEKNKLHNNRFNAPTKRSEVNGDEKKMKLGLNKTDTQTKNALVTDSDMLYNTDNNDDDITVLKAPLTKEQLAEQHQHMTRNEKTQNRHNKNVVTSILTIDNNDVVFTDKDIIKFDPNVYHINIITDYTKYFNQFICTSYLDPHTLLSPFLSPASTTSTPPSTPIIITQLPVKNSDPYFFQYERLYQQRMFNWLQMKITDFVLSQKMMDPDAGKEVLLHHTPVVQLLVLFAGPCHTMIATQPKKDYKIAPTSPKNIPSTTTHTLPSAPALSQHGTMSIAQQSSQLSTSRSTQPSIYSSVYKSSQIPITEDNEDFTILPNIALYDQQKFIVPPTTHHPSHFSSILYNLMLATHYHRIAQISHRILCLDFWLGRPRTDFAHYWRNRVIYLWAFTVPYDEETAQFKNRLFLVCATVLFNLSVFISFSQQIENISHYIVYDLFLQNSLLQNYVPQKLLLLVPYVLTTNILQSIFTMVFSPLVSFFSFDCNNLINSYRFRVRMLGWALWIICLILFFSFFALSSTIFSLTLYYNRCDVVFWDIMEFYFTIQSYMIFSQFSVPTPIFFALANAYGSVSVKPCGDYRRYYDDEGVNQVKEIEIEESHRDRRRKRDTDEDDGDENDSSLPPVSTPDTNKHSHLLSLTSLKMNNKKLYKQYKRQCMKDRQQLFLKFNPAEKGYGFDYRTEGGPSYNFNTDFFAIKQLHVQSGVAIAADADDAIVMKGMDL